MEIEKKMYYIYYGNWGDFNIDTTEGVFKLCE